MGLCTLNQQMEFDDDRAGVQPREKASHWSHKWETLVEKLLETMQFGLVFW